MDDKTIRFIIAAGVIGLVAYLLVKQTKGTAPTVSRPPSSAGPGQTSTSLVKDIQQFGTLVNSIGGFFKSSSSGPAVPSSTTMTNLSNPTAQSAWNNVSDSQLDTLAAEDAAAGVEGPF